MKWFSLLALSAVVILMGEPVNSADPPAVRKESIEKLIAKLGSPKFAERAQAKKDLIALGKPALAPLRIALESKDPEVVRLAEECIPIIERNVLITAFIEDLKDEDRKLRLYAAQGLAQLGPLAERAVPALIEALKDEDAAVRGHAMQALGRMGPKAAAAVPALLAIFFKAEPGAKVGVAYFLAQIGCDDPKVPAALIPILQDKDVYLRLMTAEVMGNLGKQPALCVPALLALLHKREGFDDREVTLMILARLRQIRSQSMGNLPMSIVVRALGKFGPGAKTAVPALIDVMKDGKQMGETIEEAIDGLGAIGPEAREGIPILQALTQTMYNGIYAVRAMRALAAIQKGSP